MTQSQLICSECNKIMPIMRIKGQAREKNHIKTIYCYGCKKETEMREVREFDWEGACLYE